jgi:hypothetical protein
MQNGLGSGGPWSSFSSLFVASFLFLGVGVGFCTQTGLLFSARCIFFIYLNEMASSSPA